MVDVIRGMVYQVQWNSTRPTSWCSMHWDTAQSINFERYCWLDHRLLDSGKFEFWTFVPKKLKLSFISLNIKRSLPLNNLFLFRSCIIAHCFNVISDRIGCVDIPISGFKRFGPNPSQRRSFLHLCLCFHFPPLEFHSLLSLVDIQVSYSEFFPDPVRKKNIKIQLFWKLSKLLVQTTLIRRVNVCQVSIERCPAQWHLHWCYTMYTM